MTDTLCFLDSNEQLYDQRLVSSFTGFARYARDNGFNVGLQESVDCQRVAASMNITSQYQLRNALKTLLCCTPSDWDSFDELFDVYWLKDKKRHKTKATIGGKAKRTNTLGKMAGANSGGNKNFDIPDANSLEGTGSSSSDLSHEGASATESLEKKDFNQLVNTSELKALEALAEQIAKKIRRNKLHRYHFNHSGRRIDIRRTLRDSLQFGGLPMELSYQKRRQQIPKLVIMLDVSRSMSVYSYLFLRFARGILGAFKDADAYAFHTRLLHIGEVLREPSREKLAAKMALVSSGWEGGTRIDKSLREFNRSYASRVLNNRSIVVIVSDGYDTGKATEMAKQLRRIKNRCRRIVWVNPLLGLQNYEPSSQCMKAALPLIDVFAPGNNLESLSGLEDALLRL